MFLHLSVILSTGGGFLADTLPRAPWADTHPTCGPWADTHPRQTPPGQTPPGHHPSGQTAPPSGRQLLQRTVRILLECILVSIVFKRFLSPLVNYFEYVCIRVASESRPTPLHAEGSRNVS